MTVKELLAVAHPDLVMDICVDREWEDLEIDVEDAIDKYGDLIVNRFTAELTLWGEPEVTFELYLTKEDN